ncbi:MAG: flagellar basal body P-ring protein FlgI, partial [Alphaproteobacteria bacterium]
MQQTAEYPSSHPSSRRIRVGRWLVFLAVLPLAALLASPAAGQSRIKDIVDFEGVRENLLVGYGLVVGLNGTGDTLNSAVFTKESLIGMLE